jgi:hypothetical protein
VTLTILPVPLAALVAAERSVTPFTEKVAVPLLVGLLGLVGVIATAAVSIISGRWAQATNRRRDAYAAAVKTLVGWAEYPYRIRRRTSDDPNELARLVGIGHDLQEQLRCHQTWIATESHRVAGVYREALEVITAQVAPACNDAWAYPPITSSADMNLGDWGPQDILPSILRVQSAIACRFGWRRVTSLLGIPRSSAPIALPSTAPESVQAKQTPATMHTKQPADTAESPRK